MAGRRALVFEADRTDYSIEQVAARPWNCLRVGDLLAFLEGFDEDDLIVLSHDQGYTYGSMGDSKVYEQNEDGDWEQDETY